MRGKSKRRLKAERLRREQGLSYYEISLLTDVSKSTLSQWLRGISLTPEQEDRIQQRQQDNQTSFVSRARVINRERFQRARETAFEAGVLSISGVKLDDSIHELAFAMLYLGEGGKAGNRVQIANTNPSVLRYFIWVMDRLYEAGPGSARLRLNLVEAARPMEAEMINWWSGQLSCPIPQFQRTQFDHRSSKSSITGEYHGVCTVTYNDTYLQQRIIGVYAEYLRRCIGGKKEQSLLSEE